MSGGAGHGIERGEVDAKQRQRTERKRRAGQSGQLAQQDLERSGDRPTERGSVAEDHVNREQKSGCPLNPSLPAQPDRVEPYAPSNRSFPAASGRLFPHQNWRTAMTDAVRAETPCFAQHRFPWPIPRNLTV
jgi:hypothetical protein